MFNQKEDKEILELKWREFLDDKRKSRLKRYYSLLQAIKIIFMYIFAFVGISFIMYHYIFGQPYVCSIYETDFSANNNIQEILLQGCYNGNRECDNDLMNCRDEVYIITENCSAYCLREIFEPTCKKIMY